jgi:DNA primase
MTAAAAKLERLPEWMVEAARTRVPLSRVVGRHLALKKAGSEWAAPCPFHKENTPSFFVNDQKRFYHCFGCGAHGDAIAWTMQMREQCRFTTR